MDRYRYFNLNQRSVLVLGVLQVACAGLCMVCGFMDAAFRKDTELSSTRTPVWGGLIMAAPGVLAVFASQRKHSVLVSVMVAAAGLSCVAVLFIFGYACLTLTYGEEDEDVFHHHDSPRVTFVLHRLVKGANATILLACTISLMLSSLIAYTGCRSLPCCGCYDSRTGLVRNNIIPMHVIDYIWKSVIGMCVHGAGNEDEGSVTGRILYERETLVPQCDPGDTEMVCTWQAGGDDRLFNSPPQSTEQYATEKEGASKLPPYSRLT